MYSPGVRILSSRILALLLVTLVFVIGLVAPSRADEAASSVSVRAVVNADGSLAVTETLQFDGTAPKLEQRLALTRPGLGDEILTYSITEVAATADGVSLEPATSHDGGYLVISVDGTKAAAGQPIEISYLVTGAAVAQPQVEGQEATTKITWRYLQGLNIAVRDIDGMVELPGGTIPLDVDCQAGAPVATTTCQTYAAGTFEAMNPQFTDGPLGVGEVVEMSIVVPRNKVAANQQISHRWSLDRAFSAGLPEVLAALAALIIGGGLLYLVHRKFGTDQGKVNPIRVAEFVPTAAGEETFKIKQQLRPGEVGTLVDERVDPIDITATLIDLAQRGYLTIIELPRESEFALRDWTFARRGNGSDLYRYEQILLEAIAPEDGTVVNASNIEEAVAPVIGELQEAIYAQMATEHYFVKRPDKVRATWGRYGLATLAAAIVIFFALAIFTTFGILGLVLIALAIAMLWVARRMPRRTPKGKAILAGLEILATDLRNQNTSHVPAKDAYGEISRILPYAVVLGGLDRWLDALSAADDDPGVPDPVDLDWYHAPPHWQLSDLRDSLDHFMMLVQAKFFRR